MPRLKNVFTSSNFNKPRRNKFDMSHEKKLSFKFGHLVPMFLQEVIPSDTWRVRTEVYLRFAPLLAPVMHRINVYTHFFFVPNRLVWDEWEDFITGGSDLKWSRSDGEIPDIEQIPVFPQIEMNQTTAPMLARGSLADFLGIPEISASGLDPTPDNSLRFSALPFRGYQLIYNEYYRDQNLIDSVPIDTDSGVDGSAAVSVLATMRKRAWEKDYFTTCLPFASKFGEAVIPGGSQNLHKIVNPQGVPITASHNLGTGAGGKIHTYDQSTNAIVHPDVYVTGDNAQAGGTINDLREANALQRWLETAARNGTRYVEQLKAHFGVTPADSRLMRPEYLGGGMQPVSISEVLNQTGTVDHAQGDMTGHGISSGGNHGFKRDFTEHGYIMGIISVIPRASYQDGLARHWRKFDKYDFFFPEFAHLGEQPVTTSEVRFNWNDATDLFQTFGYQQRYGEYKYAYSNTHGDFKKTLAFWHLSREFATKPFLNQTFVECTPRIDIFAGHEAGGDYLWCQIYHNADALRPIPYFSIPSLK